MLHSIQDNGRSHGQKKLPNSGNIYELNQKRMKMGNKAIYTYINGRKTFVGKQINDVIHREFDFSKAVLWQNKELSFDERLLLYAQNQKIKSFVFTDTRKKTSFKFGLKKILNNGRFDQHGVGDQWYFPKDIGKEIRFKKTPYVKKEVILHKESFTQRVEEGL